MTRRARLAMFLAGALGLAVMLACAEIFLPGPEKMRSRYLEQINLRTAPERNITDAVTAVNFDYRGFDTVGEEFILFVSVMGSIVLLRQPEEKQERSLRDAVTEGRDVPPSPAMRLWIVAMVAPKVLFGIYVVTHGQLTPGGGFQGGVILASCALIIYVGENFDIFKKVMSHRWLELAEGGGAGLFVVLGMIAWLWGSPFLTNTLPLGKRSELTSGGTIPLISIATGLEVMAGFVLLLHAFLQETLTKSSE
ncbi:MAG TPA: MnhB domain-containing protein [Tepidisphaeraceae bacterium]|nr:MnhB domain-containing protein [Tepidisphaeraceae bacterium]